MARLEVENLIAEYNGVRAVKGIDFHVPDGQFVTLLGPSGCGKTTTLRCIAGLERTSGGEIRIDDQVVASRSVHVAPEKRRMNMVFQSYAIWPHMTVSANVGYGLRNGKLGKKERQAQVLRALDIVGLRDYASRYGTELSGGQQQRVALARAIVTNPRVLLLDEPLSNLDAGLRVKMRHEIVDLQKEVGTTSIYVTHDQTEAMVMSDQIILMRDGLIVQTGTAHELYERPKTRFAAEFIGVSNFIEVTVAGDRDSSGIVEVVTGSGKRLKALMPEAGTAGPGDKALVTVRPENVEINPQPGPDLINQWSDGTMSDTVYLGNKLECRVQVDGQPLSVDLHPGRPVADGVSGIVVAIRPERLIVLPYEGATSGASAGPDQAATPAPPDKVRATA
ncbi:MAG TPA: ABC transporter ATP-binding protein [Streptosporangiaceae bacterium]|jgi:ABC-type Fe3+/spermidine/putrescine transport system ATPase subunit